MKFGKTEISPGFFLAAAFLFFFDTDGIFLCALTAAFLHEMAHLVAIRCKGGSVGCIRLTVFGAEIDLRDTHRISYLSEVLIYLSGPVVNLICAFLFSCLGNWFSNEYFFLFAGVNCLLGILNLLPIKRLDGGNAVRSLCMQFCGRIPFAVTVLHTAAAALVAATAFLFMRDYGMNVSLLAVSGYLLIGGLFDNLPAFRGLSNERG